MRETAVASAPERPAMVLDFPIDRARPPSAQSRLARALQLLRDALAEQHQAALALNKATAQLGASLAELEARLESHRDGLTRLAGDVAELHAAARRLGTLTDRVTAAEHRRR